MLSLSAEVFSVCCVYRGDASVMKGNFLKRHFKGIWNINLQCSWQYFFNQGASDWPKFEKHWLRLCSSYWAHSYTALGLEGSHQRSASLNVLIVMMSEPVFPCKNKQAAGTAHFSRCRSSSLAECWVPSAQCFFWNSPGWDRTIGQPDQERGMHSASLPCRCGIAFPPTFLQEREGDVAWQCLLLSCSVTFLGSLTKAAAEAMPKDANGSRGFGNQLNTNAFASLSKSSLDGCFYALE